MKNHVMRRQRGMAALALLVVLILGSLWWLVSALSTPANRTALKRDHNANVLQQAKAALIGYVAQQAAQSGEEDPGRLPCPQNWGDIGSANEGRASANCVPTATPARPAIGWLPWRTLGLPKLLDASGEQLWYVVSPGWALPTNGDRLIINSDSVGQMALNGQAVVALIIAPGTALAMESCGGAPARTQSRTKQPPTLNPDHFDYLECENAISPVGTAFVNAGPSASFNDQLLAVTLEDVLPAIEAAVAARFVREFRSNLRYCDAPWQPCTSAVFSPFAASFPLTNFQGTANVREGLLPLNYAFTGPCTTAFCTPGVELTVCDSAADPQRCKPSFVAWRNNSAVITKTAGTLNVGSFSCPPPSGTPSTLTCTLNAYASITLTQQPDRWMTFTLDVTADKVGMAFRQVNTKVRITDVDTDAATGVNPPYGYSVQTATMNGDGSATLRINSRIKGNEGSLIGDLACGLLAMLALQNDCYEYVISVPIMFSDQPLLHANNATAAWFYRNGWHERMYYAVSQGNAPSGTGTCTAGTTCLSVNGLTPGNTQRSIVVIPGPRLAALGQVRPPLTVTDWLEGANADGTSPFALRDPAAMINRTFNDHIGVIDSN